MKIFYVIISKHVKFDLQYNYIDLTLNKLFFHRRIWKWTFFQF